MTLTLYDNPFSPFARKVRVAMDHKGIEADYVNGLDKRQREALAQINGRVEVPALVHDDIVVVGSSDIVAYLERRFSERPLYPADMAEYVRARAWERCADTVIDPILTDISLWTWAERTDEIPDGMLEAARSDLEQVYEALASELRDRDFVCGALSIADIALFPHLAAVRGLGVSFDGERHPQILAWLKRLRAMPMFEADIARARAFVASALTGDGANIERRKVFWRGERIEWLLARGYHPWFMGEIEAGRVLWPGLGIPKSH